MKIFKVYVAVSLLVIILLLAALVGSIYYAGQKVNQESTSVTNNINGFNKNISNINKNLQGISTQLQQENAKLSSGSSFPIP
ncbi:MAG TPA: hypothetical protein VFN51_00155 [Candidatus Saccharimonadales bacterium]|nr:hypothetical protein [Candidatus Saccharimonadales bacterium]